MSPERRSEIAREAVRARWERGRSKPEILTSPLRTKKLSAWKNSRMHEDRVYRTSVAKKLALDTGLDPGDIEHALYNLTLEPMERIRRSLRSRP